MTPTPLQSAPDAGIPGNATTGGGPQRALESLRRVTRIALGLRSGRSVSYVPLTALGWVVATLSGLALYFYGLGSLDLLLFVIGISGLGLVLLSAAAVTATALYLRRRTARARTDVQQLEAISPIRTGFALPELRAIPLIQLRWEWLRPGDVEVRPRPAERQLLEEVIAHARGEEASIVRRLYVESAFGLARAWWDVEEARPIQIRPWTGLLQRSAALRSLASADGTPHPSGAPEGDRMEIRRYAPGDSARHILWPRYAKTRELVVRNPERSVDPTRRIVAYLIGGPGDEPAAAAARVALERGALGESWLFGADGTPEPQTDVAGSLEAISHSAASSVRGQPCGLARFLRRVDPGGGMHCVVFAPGTAGPWVASALDALTARTGRASFVLGVDGIAPARRRPVWWNWIFEEPAASGAASLELSRVSDMLGRSGSQVVIADRQTGRYSGEFGPARASRRGQAHA